MKNNSVLPFAFVSIKNRPVGVIANENGLFEFHVAKENIYDTLVISSLGYESFIFPIRYFTDDDGPLTITLNPVSVNLKQIDVNAPSVVDLIQKVKAAYRSNYNTVPFLTTSFFRTSMQENGVYTNLREVSVTGYDKGFDVKKSNWKMPVYFINQIRPSQANGTVPHIARGNGIEEVNSTVHLEVLKMLSDNNYVFSYTDPIYEDAVLYHVLSFFHKEKSEEVTGRFIIRSDNYCIKEIEALRVVTDKSKLKPKQSNALNQEFLSLSFLVQYKEYENQTYLSHIKKVYTTEIYTKNKSTDFPLVIINELSVNSITTGNVRMPEVNKMNLHQGLYSQSYKYSNDPDFWKNYNMISDSPELAKIREDLDRKESFER